MASKDQKLKARLPRGLADRTAADIRATERMVATIKAVYERYGFEPVETPLIEYTDALGKFLPDQDRPNEGVFSFQDDDEQWLSLRYDLTAPLARTVAENFDRLPKPYRSYRAGWVFRNEKPGPGRFRQFMQFDADTVGSASPAADAEMCMMMADTLEALGIARGQYVVKVNSRKVLDGVMEAIGLAGDENAGKRLSVLRAIDKLDRLGLDGVRKLLGPGREDESGDFTKGAGLGDDQIAGILGLVTTAPQFVALEDRFTTQEEAEAKAAAMPAAERPAVVFHKTAGLFGLLSNDRTIKNLKHRFGGNAKVDQALDELQEISLLTYYVGYRADQISIDPSVVRGLEYYTGPVFEAELLFEIPNEKGQPVVFGSVGGGGRYDGLVGRFRGEDVPATGFSIGVSRLQAALTALGKIDASDVSGPVVVTVMEPERIGEYQRFVQTLRDAKLTFPDGRPVGVELYLGAGKFNAQMKYADRRNAPLVIIQGENERKKSPPMLQIKDLRAGKALSAIAKDRDAWTQSRSLSQQEWPVDQLVEAVERALGAKRTQFDDGIDNWV